MNAEYLSAAASLGTFIVIAATAIVAIFQLRHIRAANQLAGAIHVTERYRSPDMQAAMRFVHEQLHERLKDPQYRAELIGPDPDRRTHPELQVADMFEQIGSYVKYGMIGGKPFTDLGGSLVRNMWDGTKDAIALRRFGSNSSSMYENFEYLAALANEFQQKYPDGNYPRGVQRLMKESEWKNLGTSATDGAPARPTT